MFRPADKFKAVAKFEYHYAKLKKALNEAKENVDHCQTLAEDLIQAKENVSAKMGKRADEICGERMGG